MPRDNTLYIADILVRAITRAADIRSAGYDPITKRYKRGTHSLYALKKKTGIASSLMSSYLAFNTKIPPIQADKLMACLEFDVLDLLEPRDFAEIERRKQEGTRKRGEHHTYG